MPEIKWIGSPNFHAGRNGYKPVAIVNHIMCGTEAGTDSWFQNPQSQVSAHYGIAKDGTIHQYVKDEDTAWAVGATNKPDWSLMNDYPGVNPNYYTISIEHEGFPQDGLTEAQYQSTLWLHKKLTTDHAIKPDEVHIVGHNVLDTVNRVDCPGSKFPWDRLFKDLGGDAAVLLEQGSTGELVMEVQKKINALGYTPMLTEDGDYGPKTEQAVRWFQGLKHIQIDGKVGPQTWAELNPTQAPQPAPTPAPAKPAEPTPTPQPTPAQPPTQHHVLQIDVDMETGKVIDTKEVTE